MVSIYIRVACVPGRSSALVGSSGDSGPDLHTRRIPEYNKEYKPDNSHSASVLPEARYR